MSGVRVDVNQELIVVIVKMKKRRGSVRLGEGGLGCGVDVNEELKLL